MGSSRKPSEGHKANKLATTHATSQGGLQAMSGTGVGQNSNGQEGVDLGLIIALIELDIVVVKKSLKGNRVEIDIETGKEVYVTQNRIGNIPERFREQVKKLGRNAGIIVVLEQDPPKVHISL